MVYASDREKLLEYLRSPEYLEGCAQLHARRLAEEQADHFRNYCDNPRLAAPPEILPDVVYDRNFQQLSLAG